MLVICYGESHTVCWFFCSLPALDYGALLTDQYCRALVSLSLFLLFVLFLLFSFSPFCRLVLLCCNNTRHSLEFVRLLSLTLILNREW